MRRVSVSAAALLLTAVVSIEAGRLPIANSVWPIATAAGDNFCTATSINSDLHLWLTAAHCLASEEPGHIMGEEILPMVVDEGHDIAFVHTPTKHAPAIHLAQRGPRCYADAHCDAVRVIGYPFGFPFQVFTEGTLAARRGEIEPGRFYALFNVTGAPGNSGSAILNASGEIVSVLQIGWGRSFSPMVGGVVFDTLLRYRELFEE